MPALFKIREDHVAAFDRYMFKKFEKRMLEHLAKVFPEKFQAMGLQEARRIIRKGHNKAFRYRITTERNVSLFIDLTIGLDQEFDTAEKYAWIREILDNKNRAENNRMDEIFFLLPYRT